MTNSNSKIKLKITKTFILGPQTTINNKKGLKLTNLKRRGQWCIFFFGRVRKERRRKNSVHAMTRWKGRFGHQIGLHTPPKHYG